MKKLIYGITLLTITSTVVLMACNKQNPAPNNHPKTKTETSFNVEKSSNLTDNQLIDIIKGRNESYTKVEEIEEILFENCKLRSSVLRTLADDLRFPNYIVEEWQF